MSQAKIQRITLHEVRVPVPRERVNCPEFSDRMLQQREPGGAYGGTVFFGDVPYFVVEVSSGSGPKGYSDSSRLATTAMLAAAARSMLGKTLDDISAERAMLDVTECEARENRIGHQYVHPCKCLETAALDWKARQLGVPLWRVLGAQVRDRVRVEYWSGFRTPQGAARVTADAVRLGFLGLKLKADTGLDVAGVTRAVFDTAGPDFHLNIDPNGQWRNVDDAVARAKAMLAVSGNVILEDPIYGDYAAVAEIRRRTGIPMGVTISQPAWMQRAIELDATDSFNIGGTWHQKLACARTATRMNKPFWIGSGLETGMCDLAAIHFGCTQPMCTIGSDLMGNLMREDDLLVSPIRFDRGHAIVPTAPGLGIDVDLDAVERYRVADPVVVE